MIRSARGLLRAECATRPAVMGIALHPYLMGEAHRFPQLAGVLRALREEAGSDV